MANTTKTGAATQVATARKPAPDWVSVRIAYVHSTKTIAQVADDFGINPHGVEGRSERERWVDLRRKASESIGAAVEARLIKERTDELTAWNRLDLTIAKAIRRQIAAKVNAAEKANLTLEPKDIRALSGSAESTQRIGRLALGATTENTGVSAPGGGPVETETVSPAEYEAALRRVLADL